MRDFLDHLRQKAATARNLLLLMGGAVLLGSAMPFVVAVVTREIPWLAPVLNVEGDGLGLNAVFLPAGMLGVTVFCLILEAAFLGYPSSTARQIITNDMPSVRTDVFYLAFRVSGLLMIFSLLFSFGGLYLATNYMRENFGFGLLAGVDSFIVQFVVWVLIYTFLNYWAHRLMHTKILWDIHQVHHSAEHYNVLLPYRNHPVEYVVATLYAVGATVVLGVRPEVIMVWLAVNAVYQSMVHSHLDWQWRWVEYILITPAAHRIHHSTAPEHFNSNLGILSLWDRIFGTYVRPKGETINFGVPEQENFNTDRYFSEMIACFFRWLTIKRPRTRGAT